MNRILLLSFLLWGCICLQAKKYTIQDIPMVHLEDRMRYVSNPDSILSDSIVARMDSMLYALEEKTGIQTMVVAVTGIEISQAQVSRLEKSAIGAMRKSVSVVVS